MLKNYPKRQEVDDEMERLLVKAGVEGGSHMVLPPRNELLEGELKVQIKEGDYAGVLIILPKAVRNETEDVARGLVGPYYSPPAGY